MKNFFKICSALALILVSTLCWVQFKFNQESSINYHVNDFKIREEVLKADVKFGERLYRIRSGCIECHGDNLAGVMIMDDPAMGKIHGANITPFNLSSWSDEEIARAIRYGIHKTGRSLKFMPSFDYEGMSKEDIAALISYLRSASSVENSKRENSFGLMAKGLAVFGKMPVMFPAKSMNLTKGFGEKPAEAPTLEFGRYLAHSCIGCHGSDFKGGKIPGGDPSWPEASNIRLGANPNWNENAFQQAIRSGISPLSGNVLRPPMPVKLLQQFNETEIKALWEFLVSLK